MYSSNIWRPANAHKCMTGARVMEPRGAGVMASIASEGFEGEIININNKIAKSTGTSNVNKLSKIDLFTRKIPQLTRISRLCGFQNIRRLILQLILLTPSTSSPLRLPLCDGVGGLVLVQSPDHQHNSEH